MTFRDTQALDVKPSLDDLFMEIAISRERVSEGVSLSLLLLRWSRDTAAAAVAADEGNWHSREEGAQAARSRERGGESEKGSCSAVKCESGILDRSGETPCIPVLVHVNPIPCSGEAASLAPSPSDLKSPRMHDLRISTSAFSPAERHEGSHSVIHAADPRTNNRAARQQQVV